MIIYIDIDETICRTPDSRDYSLAVPIKENIKKSNKLFDEGHRVVYWTSRGVETGIDWRAVTEEQLRIWGAKYHELKFDKPVYVLFIDDRSMNTKDWDY